MGARFTLLIKQLQDFLLDFRIPACVHQIDVNNSLIYTQVRDRWKASLLRQFCRILGLICHLIFGLWYECPGAAFETNIWSWLRNFVEQLLQSWHWKMFSLFGTLVDIHYQRWWDLLNWTIFCY